MQEIFLPSSFIAHAVRLRAAQSDFLPAQLFLLPSTGLATTGAGRGRESGGAYHLSHFFSNGMGGLGRGRTNHTTKGLTLQGFFLALNDRMTLVYEHWLLQVKCYLNDVADALSHPD